VAIARQGQESVDITAGPNADSGRQFVLPPADATEIRVDSMSSSSSGIEDPLFYGIDYRDVDGSPRMLIITPRQGPWFNSAPDDSVVTTPAAQPTTGDPVADSGLPATWPRISIGAPFGPAAITCGATIDPAVYAANPDSLTAEIVLSATVPTGPAVVVGTLGDNWGLALSEWPPPRTDIPCELGPTVEASLTAAAQSLRLVSEDEWRQFIEEHGDAHNPYDNLQSSDATMVAPPDAGWHPSWLGPESIAASIPPGVAIPGEDEARAAIEAAIAGLSEPAADGTYPNLENGVDGATYEAMFDEARTISKAEPGGTFALTSARFVSETEAEITFVAAAILASGPINITLSGRAVKIDDRWVVSRDTITSMLGRASLAPPTPN